MFKWKKRIKYNIYVNYNWVHVGKTLSRKLNRDKHRPKLGLLNRELRKTDCTVRARAQFWDNTPPLHTENIGWEGSIPPPSPPT